MTTITDQKKESKEKSKIRHLRYKINKKNLIDVGKKTKEISFFKKNFLFLIEFAKKYFYLMRNFLARITYGKNFSISTKWLKRNLVKFIMIFISAISLIFIFLNLYPNQVANWLWPNSHLPLLILSNLLIITSTSLFFPKRWTLFLTLYFSIYFLCFVNFVILPFSFWLMFFLTALILESAYFFLKKLLANEFFSDILRHSKHSQKKFRRKR